MTSDSYSSGTNLFRRQVSTNIQRQKSLLRKEAARRNLLDSIYARRSDSRYSLPCLSTERLQSYVKFPRVNSRERSARAVEHFHARNKCASKYSQCVASPNSSIEILDESSRNDTRARNGHCGYVRNLNRQKMSLPEVIMEFNLETNQLANNNDVCMMSLATEDERALGAPYEDYLKRTKYNSCNPCRSRYRPLTPGLLESLNKSKVPSKIKTEQWVKSTLSMRKSLYGHVYKTEHIDNTNSAFPNWIYTD